MQNSRTLYGKSSKIIVKNFNRTITIETTNSATQLHDQLKYIFGRINLKEVKDYPAPEQEQAVAQKEGEEG
jgi:hypothetical protein